MQSYPIPPESDDREKIIGGVLDMRQFIWIAVGFGIALIVVLLTYSFFGIFSFIIGIVFGSSTLPFAFYTKHGLTLVELLNRQREFDRKTKELPNIVKNNKDK